MIGNNYLRILFKYPREDIAVNEILEFLTYKDAEFIDSLWTEPVNLSSCNQKEIQFLTKVAALIDYFLQHHGMEVPDWLRDNRLCFDKPHYYSKRLNDFEKFKLLYSSPAPFKRRNVYFDLGAIKRF